ncbi:hypothetical protein GF361_04740 [Candidatus Woesearchaeota archaeon]|nr:hypothetical protein [Candidatus Woesearchaeota archaeon]
MKKILSLLIVLVFLTGCGITGKIIEEVEEQPTQEEKDQAKLDEAVEEKDVSKCYYIQEQLIREECFKVLAKELNDPSICNNLLGGLKESCKEEI